MEINIKNTIIVYSVKLIKFIAFVKLELIPLYNNHSIHI